MTDNVNKPKHYQGTFGLEAIDVMRNFIFDLTGMSALLLERCYEIPFKVSEEKWSRRFEEG